MTADYHTLLHKTVEALEKNPAEIRHAIYDLVRHELQRKLLDPNCPPAEAEAERAALEAAIQRIEAESATPQPELDATSGEPVSPRDVQTSLSAHLSKLSPVRDRLHELKRRLRAPDRKHMLAVGKVAAAVALGALMAGGGGYLLMQSKSKSVEPMAAATQLAQKPQLPQKPASTSSSAAKPTPVAAAAISPRSPPPNPTDQLEFPVPDVYGVYALQNGTLTELRGLPMTSPDRKASPWTIFREQSRTSFADGRLAFVVFRRSLMTNAPDRVVVSIVARVASEMTTSPTGQVMTTPVTQQWFVRGTGYEFRVAPIRGQPEMIMVKHEQPGFVLPPGRYAVLLGDQAYDFVVDGPVADPAHCVERTMAVNTTVYSECAAASSPPARASKK